MVKGQKVTVSVAGGEVKGIVLSYDTETRQVTVKVTTRNSAYVPGQNLYVPAWQVRPRK